MIFADQTRAINLKLAGAITTSQLSVTGAYSEMETTGAVTGGSAIHTVTNSTTEVAVVASPSAGHLRKLQGLSIRNGDTAAATVILYLDDGSNERDLIRVTLAVGDVLTVADDGSYQVHDSSGKLKEALTLSGSGDTLLTFTPLANEPPSTNYATLDTRNGHPVLDFDTTTQETAIFSGVMPQHYTGGGVTVILHWMASSATSGTIGWDVAFERDGDGGTDLDADSFGTAATVTAETVNGTSGIVSTSQVNVANGADMDSAVAGDAFRLRVRRDVANDNAAGDAELLKVEIREQ